MKKAVMGLRSDFGYRLENINRAMQAVKQLPGTTILAASRFYETIPDKDKGLQSGFVSACILLLTELSPHTLHGAGFGIAASLKREQESIYKEAVSLDLLLYEDAAFRDTELKLPNLEYLNQDFVLKGLNDLFPEKMALGLDFSSVFRRADFSETSLFQEK